MTNKQLYEEIKKNKRLEEKNNLDLSKYIIRKKKKASK